MDENRTVAAQMEAVLREKIDEFSTVDIESENAPAAAEALAKATDSYTKLEQQKQSKKDFWVKILTPVGAFLGVIGAAVVKAIVDKQIADEQIDYLLYEHGRAYKFEEEGKTEHIVTSPAAKDALRERPRGK